MAEDSFLKGSLSRLSLQFITPARDHSYGQLPSLPWWGSYGYRKNVDNEILIMKPVKSLVGPMYIPTLLTGPGNFSFSFFANDVLVPAGTIEFGKLYRSILLTTPALELRSHSVKRFKDTVIVTGAITKIPYRICLFLIVRVRENDGLYDKTLSWDLKSPITATYPWQWFV